MNIFDTFAKKFSKKIQSKSHPKIEKKEFYMDKPSNASSNENNTFFRIESPCGTPYNYSINYSTNGYIKNPIAFRAVNIIAHTASSIPLIVMKNDGDKKYKITNTQLSNLVHRPNPYTSKIDFIEIIVYQLLIHGNAFLLKIHDSENKICEIYNLNPENIEFLFDRSGNSVIGYRYHKENGRFRDYKIDRITNSCDVLHLKNFNPNDNIHGLSPFAAASNAIEQHNTAMEWNKSLLKNGARPSGALIVKNEKGSFLTEIQRNELKKEIDYLFSGSENIGRPILLEGGIDWKDLGISPRELDFANSDQIAVRHIANAFGVPIQMLNNSESSSYNNYLEGKKSLYENTILPLLDKIISNVYNCWVCECFGKEYFVTYNEDDIPALSYKKEQLLQNLKNSDFLTINEKRAILGFDPIAGGDKL
jgi:HK97 family phage portal protein